MTTETAPNGKAMESVWDYPRPPRVERVPWRVRVVHGGLLIVDAPAAVRVLETSQPPTYYVEEEFVRMDCLRRSDETTVCEWKGTATYADVVSGAVVAAAAAWTYGDPAYGFEELAGRWAFYAQRLDECWLDDEQVTGSPGLFYGGWITENVTGPFKGGPGTADW
jgi:uncharacterized protein (DUF427 family)